MNQNCDKRTLFLQIISVDISNTILFEKFIRNIRMKFHLKNLFEQNLIRIMLNCGVATIIVLISFTTTGAFIRGNGIYFFTFPGRFFELIKKYFCGSSGNNTTTEEKLFFIPREGGRKLLTLGSGEIRSTCNRSSFVTVLEVFRANFQRKLFRSLFLAS